MKKIFSFFRIIDEKIWGDKVNTNPYFATICLIFVALTGAINGGGAMLDGLFDMDIDTNLTQAFGFCAFIFGINMYESIIASSDIKTMITRSLLMLGAVVVIAVLGYVLSAVIIFLVVAAVTLWIIFMVLSMTIFGGPSKATITDSFGRKVKLEKNLSGDYKGSDGKTYHDNHDGTVTPE